MVWSSDNTAVATVDASTGVVTAVSAGTANIIATSNLTAKTSPNKTQYVARMEAYRDDLVARGLITGRQGGKVLACAGKAKGVFPKL